MKRRRSSPPVCPESSACAGYRFPSEVNLLAVRWYLRFGLSYRDLEELLAERGVDVDHVTLFRWVQHSTPELVDAARPCRHAVGDRWFADETYVNVAGRRRYVYRAVDQYGHVIDVYVSGRRDIAAARRFFSAALAVHGEPAVVVTDLSPALEHVVAELLPDAFHNTDQYANNPIECDDGPLKARLRSMRGLKTDRTASAVIRGHGFIQNLRRGPYELSGDAPSRHLRVAATFDELANAIGASAAPLRARRPSRSLNATCQGPTLPARGAVGCLHPSGRGLRTVAPSGWLVLPPGESRPGGAKTSLARLAATRITLQG